MRLKNGLRTASAWVNMVLDEHRFWYRIIEFSKSANRSIDSPNTQDNCTNATNFQRGKHAGDMVLWKHRRRVNSAARSSSSGLSHTADGHGTRLGGSKLSRHAQHQLVSCKLPQRRQFAIVRAGLAIDSGTRSSPHENVNGRGHYRHRLGLLLHHTWNQLGNS